MGQRLKQQIPAITLALILTAGWWLTPAELPGWSICLIKNFLGFECPGCGLTRSFLMMARGRFAEAFAFNAGGPVLYLLFALTLLGLLVGIWDKSGKQSERVQAVRRAVQLPASILVVVLMLGHWVVKLIFLH